MKITFITAFPDFLRTFLDTSVIGKAVRSGLLDAVVLDLRDFAQGNYRQIDDYAFGGGGMVLMAEPLARAVESSSVRGKPYVVCTTPQGAVLTQEVVESLARQEHLVVVCGHYEGFDERFTRCFADLELSIGDYVLTGGELPAMVLADAVARKVPGVVGRGEAVEEDSFFRGFLDHPHFTRPAEWRGEDAPEVLLSGDHKAIDAFRRGEAVQRTLIRRPDLLCRAPLGTHLPCGAYVALVGEHVSEEERIADLCSFFGIRRCLRVSRTATEERGLKRFPSIAYLERWIEQREGSAPLQAVLGAGEAGSLHWVEAKRRILEAARPVLFLFGDKVCAEESSEKHLRLFPLEGGGQGSPGLAESVAIVLDRFFGWR